jgi:hypothetical protein
MAGVVVRPAHSLQAPTGAVCASCRAVVRPGTPTLRRSGRLSNKTVACVTGGVQLVAVKE